MQSFTTHQFTQPRIDSLSYSSLCISFAPKCNSFSLLVYKIDSDLSLGDAQPLRRHRRSLTAQQPRHIHLIPQRHLPHLCQEVVSDIDRSHPRHRPRRMVQRRRHHMDRRSDPCMDRGKRPPQVVDRPVRERVQLVEPLLYPFLNR